MDEQWNARGMPVSRVETDWMLTVKSHLARPSLDADFSGPMAGPDRHSD